MRDPLGNRAKSTTDPDIPKVWPFQEAYKLLKRTQHTQQQEVIFETGYGPSGLPHIGTFAEIVRTSMIRRAFQELSNLPTRILCFSDDLDGLRKIPENIPNPEQLKEFLNLPLSKVPDPFGTHESFAAHNNSRLIAFLEKFGFNCEFLSSTQQYTSGKFDSMLQKILENHDQIREIILPTLGEERKKTWSPFLPISPSTGKVLQVPMQATDPENGTITFQDENGENVTLSVGQGNTKLQWKVDWAMRWMALEVDYEMSGKDLISSVRESSKIVKALGYTPPIGISYEHFLDAEGQKISKSKGNGISIEQWLAYAPAESLSYFMYAKPKTAKRLHLDTIPTSMEEYNQELKSYQELNESQRKENPLWHVHAGNVPDTFLPMSFRMLLNLASVTGSRDKTELWKFLQKRFPEYTPEQNPEIDQALACATRYFQEILLPTRSWHNPSETEIEAIICLRDALQNHKGETDPETLQGIFYEIGKQKHDNLRHWFQLLYKTLLGQDQGPRWGAFVHVYGIPQTLDLINRALRGELSAIKENQP